MTYIALMYLKKIAQQKQNVSVTHTYNIYPYEGSFYIKYIHVISPHEVPK